jgi:hypothetical protein
LRDHTAAEAAPASQKHHECRRGSGARSTSRVRPSGGEGLPSSGRWQAWAPSPG